MGDRRLQEAHNRGERDGAKWAKQGIFEDLSMGNYRPPSDSAQKKAYDAGHRTGRTGGRK